MADWAAPNLPDPKPNDGSDISSTSASNLPTQLQRELSRVDASIPFRPKTGYLHHTWAQTFFSRPEYYFQPSTIPELQKIVTLARRSQRRVCVTGYGHSPSILTCTSSWLINLDNLNRILEWDVDDKPGRIRFEAGISLHNLNIALAERGFTLPNLGSIDVQSLAGVISTGTHGSSLNHGLLSQSVTSITILLSNSQLVTCSAAKNEDLFRAALISLGSLGVIIEMTFQAVPDFNISWSQSLHSLDSVLDQWSPEFWKRREYTRVWWMPYMKRAVIWSAEKTDQPVRQPKSSFYGGKLGYYIYHNLLAVSNYVPSILPWVEWFVFGMQYGFKPGRYEVTAVQPAREGLLMDCLYSQFVNEWTLPLSKGPEAITRLSAWLHGNAEKAKIPFSSKGLYVHCPIEVRVSDTTTKNNFSGVRPFLDPTMNDEPTLYLNATLYRPYGRDPPCHIRYYEGFEYLMKELGGRPHWAKNFAYTGRDEIEAMYGEDMVKFMEVRDESDPDGMFLGEWHVQYLPVENTRALVEQETGRKRFGKRYGDGVLWQGSTNTTQERAAGKVEHGSNDDSGMNTPITMSITSRASQESFDLMSKGEASVYGLKE